MANPVVPQKIVLKSTTKLTLNERFSVMRPPIMTSNTNQRTMAAAAVRATAKNRRLAKQMANRPTVQAALRMKKSMSLRLGPTNVKARLDLPVLPMSRGRGWGRSRGRGRVSSAVRGVRGGQRSMRQRGIYYNRGYRPAYTRSTYRGPGGRGLAGRGAAGRGAYMYIQRGAFRGGRGVRGRGSRGGQRGRGIVRGGRGRGQPDVTREQLDNQLDAYMAGTRTQLDHELDTYMQND